MCMQKPAPPSPKRRGKHDPFADKHLHQVRRAVPQLACVPGSPGSKPNAVRPTRLALPCLRTRQRTDEHDLSVQVLAEDEGHMLNRDDIIKLTREADPGFEADPHLGESIVGMEAIERFAALVAAAERKACAKVCEEFYSIEWLAQNCAAAIRARGEKT